MPEHTYKVVELVGTSEHGIKQAIENGITRAAETIRLLDWFEVGSVRGELDDGKVKFYQVTMKVGFRIESKEDMSQG